MTACVESCTVDSGAEDAAPDCWAGSFVGLAAIGKGEGVDVIASRAVDVRLSCEACNMSGDDIICNYTGFGWSHKYLVT